MVLTLPPHVIYTLHISHGFSLAWCLAAHALELLCDSRNCQTSDASPAEPGDLPFCLELPDSLELVESKLNVHIMPSGAEQEYMYFIIKKNA